MEKIELQATIILTNDHELDPQFILNLEEHLNGSFATDLHTVAGVGFRIHFGEPVKTL